MTSLRPWLPPAGLGALHGLNPAAGWMPAAAWGVRSRDRTQALRALVPIALGHAASLALVALAVAASVMLAASVDVIVMQVVAAAALVAVIVHCVKRRGAGRS